MHTPRPVVIIGDGFAAAAIVIHLLRSGTAAQSITMIGPNTPGRGQAYGCSNPFFRLNIREDLPIVFSEDPLHFARWASTAVDDPGAKTHAGYFYRRHDFGRYVETLFANQAGASEIAHVSARATQLTRHDPHWRIGLDSGEALLADQVILATGNPPPTWPCPVAHGSEASPDWAAKHLIENPWPGDYLNQIAPNERVILLGGGLTALDAINALVGQGHRGQVLVVSPRPYFPPAQAAWARQHQPDWPNDLTPARLVRFMRRYLPAVPTNTTRWQNAWEELRPELNRIWQGFSARQRKTLMKRVGWIWSLYRFRASPQTIDAYQQMLAAKQIEFVVGRAKRIGSAPPIIRVQLNNGRQVDGDRIVNCTGVASDPLLTQLIDDQLAAPDALGQSVAVDTQFRVINTSVDPCPNLWMIGPGTMGSLGDVVAASAISKQAELLAGQLLLRKTAQAC